MAIFSVKASFCSRSSGQGAVAQAAYRSGKKFKDENRRREFDFSQKTDRHDIHHQVLLPENAPEWMNDSEKLWNYVQNFETNLICKRHSGNHNDPIKREKSLAAREKALNTAQDSATQIIALPREFNKEQNIDMLESYLQKRFVSKGLVVDYSIHMDKGNWHAHVAIALRTVLPNGEFSEKKITSYRGIDAYKDPFSRQEFKETRRVLAEAMNNKFVTLGISERVDHRSLEDQGIKRRATVHEGPYAEILERAGGIARLCEENRSIKAQNIALYLASPSYFLNDMARQSVVFSEADLATKIHKLVDGDEKTFQDLYSKIQSVAIPEAAKQAVDGGFMYKSDELVSHFDALFETEKSLHKEDIIDLVLVGEGVAQGYLNADQAEFEYQRIGIANELVKETGHEKHTLLEMFLTNPSSLAEALAEKKIVFREKDVVNTLYGLVEGNENSYRLLEAHQQGTPLKNTLPEIANQALDLTSDSANRDITYWIESLSQRVIESDSTLQLGVHVSRDQVYTSTAQHAFEHKTLGRVERLAANTSAFELNYINTLITIQRIEAQENLKLQAKNPDLTFSYSDEQRAAIEDLLSPGQVKVLKGRAGTGKSTVLKPVVEALKAEGYDVKGMAFMGKVSEAMENDLGIEARTIDSYRLSWQENAKAKESLQSGRALDEKTRQKNLKTLKSTFADQITSKSVVVIDEGSLVGHKHYELILSKVEEAGAKVIVVKDDAQIKTLFGADISEAMDRFVEGKALTNVQRQHAPWMKEASAALNSHRIEEGLFAYEEKGCIHYLDTHESAKDAFVASYVADYDPSKTQLGMTFLNKDVRDLNEGILDSLQQKGLVKESFACGKNTLALGAKVMFEKADNKGWFANTLESPNSTSVGVKNGTFGTVEFYDEKTQEIRIRLQGDGRLVSLNTPEQRRQGKGYDAIGLGYVITSTKAECLTIDATQFLATSNENAGSSVVVLTRHREQAKIFTSKEFGTNHRELAQTIGTSSYRGTTLDYSVTDEQRPFLEKVSLYRDLSIALAKGYASNTAYKEDYLFEKGDQGRQDEEYQAVQESFNKRSRDLKEEKVFLAKDILENWKECSTFCKQASLSEEKLSLEAGLTQGRLTTIELKRFKTVEHYIEVAREAKHLWDVMTSSTPSSLIQDHHFFSEYQECKVYRNKLASVLALAPETYKPLFKTNYIYGEEETPIAYELGNGKSYERRPVSFETCLNHGAELVPESIVFEATEGGKLQSKLFETLKLYKAEKSRSAQAYHNLKELQSSSETTLHTPSVIGRLELVKDESARQRDLLAKTSLRLLDQLSYGESIPILGHLGFDEKRQEAFFEDGHQGSIREILDLYKVTTDLQEHLGLSEQLYKTVFPEGLCDKKAFAQFAGMGGEPQRLVFENGYIEHLASGGEVLYESTFDLERAYGCLSNYKKSQKKSVENWHVIKADIKSRVDVLHLDQIKSLNEAGHFLSYEGLQKEAYEALKFNIGNENSPDWKVNDEKVLSYVSGELVRAVSSMPSITSSGLRMDVQSQHRQLQIMQSVLDGGRRSLSSYHSLMTSSEASKEYTFAENSKKMWARDLLESSSGKAVSTLVEGAFGKSFANQVLRDAREDQAATLVRAFNISSGLEKGVLATRILTELEIQKEDASFILKNHLRQGGLYTNGVELQLYGLLDTKKDSASLEEREGLSQVVETFVKASTSSIDLWKDDLQKAKGRVSDIDQGYTSGLISLKDQFESMSPHKRLRYDGENLVKATLSFAKNQGVSIKVQIASLDHRSMNVLTGKGHKVFDPIRNDVLAEVSKLSEEKHWALSDAQKETFTTSVLNVALEKQALDVEIYAALEKSTLNKDIRSVYEEAACELMASSLGDSIKSREEKWATNATNTYEGKKFSMTLDIKKQALDIGVGSHEIGRSYNDVSQRYSQIKSHAIHQIQRADFDYAYLLNELRPGEKGDYEGSQFRSKSFVFEVSGKDTGKWYNTADQSRGDNVVDLITKEMGKTVNEGIDEAAHFCDSRRGDEILNELQGAKYLELEKQKQIQRIADNKVEDVHKLFAKTVSIEGTAAETYLRNERGIKGELPDSLRYIPGGTTFSYGGVDKKVYGGALASIAKDSGGDIKAIQLTYLTESGDRSLNREGEKQTKITYGSVKGAFVDLTPTSEKSRGEEGPVILAEGVETALSVKESGIRGQVYCSLGTANINNLDVNDRHVIIAADWDGGYHKPSWKLTEVAKGTLEEKGNKVTIILPVKNPEKDSSLTDVKLDFNDLLKQKGVDSVIDRVSDRLPGVCGSKSPSREPSTTKIPSSPKPSPFKTNPFKTNPFKTNPFDMKLHAKSDLGRGM